MTGHVYKKNKKPPDEEIIMAENGSMTSESEHGSEPPGRTALRHTLYRLFHSNRFQVLIVGMVVLNSLVVMVELLLELGLLERSSSDYTATRILAYANVAILALFVLEMATKVVVYGKEMIKHRMELLDMAVVLVAFSLALALGGERKPTHPLGLLIILRLWRVTKILNSMVAAVRAEAERKMGKERRARRALEREVSKLREYCLQQECELQVMRLMLRQNGIDEPTVLRPPPAVRTLSVIAEVAKEQESTSDSSDHSPSNTPLIAPSLPPSPPSHLTTPL